LRRAGHDVRSKSAAPAGAVAGANIDSTPSRFTGIHEQLGLKLEPARAPVDVVVIDSAEPPSAD
jgi:uncharacterized protein (TIGR03435 family)